MMENRSTTNLKRLTLSGLLMALTIIILFFANIMPVNKLSLYALSSFFTAIVIIEYNLRAGWVFYIASSFLAFILKAGFLPYVLFFGIYGIIKCYIEKINNIVLEYILKIIYSGAYIVLTIQVLKELFLKDTFDSMEKKNIPIWLIYIALLIAFLIYDYIYTLFIQYYNHRLRKILKIQKD